MCSFAAVARSYGWIGAGVGVTAHLSSHCCSWVNACVTEPDLTHVLYSPVMRCDIYNLHKSAWSRCDKIQILEITQTFFFRLVRFVRIWGKNYNIMKLLPCVIFNLTAFCRPKRLYFIWTILMWMGSTGPASLRCRKRDLQDKVRIPLRTKRRTSSGADKLTLSFSFPSQSAAVPSWGAEKRHGCSSLLKPNELLQFYKPPSVCFSW